MACNGVLLPAAPIVFLINLILSFPVAIADEVMYTVPEPVDVEEPEIIQFLIVQERESLLNWMVEVPVVDDVLVLVINRESPPIFLPSTSTLSAPLKSIRGFPAIAPLTTRVNPPAGLIVIA